MYLSGSVSYDVYTESKSAQDNLIAAFASKVTCGETCSAAFSADFRTNMQRNNVDSDLIDNIQADSSASVQVQDSAKDQPATNHTNGNQQPSTPSSQPDDPVQADSASEKTMPSGDWIMYGVGGLVAIVVVIAVVMVVRSRRARKVGKMKLVKEASDQRFSDERENKVKREFDHSVSQLQGNISTTLVKEREKEGGSEFDRSACSANSILQHNIIDSQLKAQILQHNLLDSQNDAHQRLMSRLRRGSVRVKKLKANSPRSAVHVKMHPLTRRSTGGGTGVDL